MVHQIPGSQPCQGRFLPDCTESKRLPLEGPAWNHSNSDQLMPLSGSAWSMFHQNTDPRPQIHVCGFLPHRVPKKRQICRNFLRWQLCVCAQVLQLKPRIPYQLISETDRQFSLKKAFLVCAGHQECRIRYNLSQNYLTCSLSPPPFIFVTL